MFLTPRLPLRHCVRLTANPMKDIRSFSLYIMKVKTVIFIAGILEIVFRCAGLTNDVQQF
jgi:hypothetical protein